MADAPVIRLLGPGEIDTAIDVANQAIGRYLALIGRAPATGRDRYSYLAQAVADGRAWAAEAEGRIVGIAFVDTADGKRWKIDIVGVLESHAGAGLGRQLMERIEADARARGVAVLELITLESAPRLWQFYQRLGFTIVRRAPPPHGLDAFTRVFMAKRLQRCECGINGS